MHWSRFANPRRQNIAQLRRKSCAKPAHAPAKWLILGVLIVIATSGCVRRRLTVRSNPPGARVYVDNQQIGSTPCSVDFTYYGTREIRLVKPGFETLTVSQPIPSPWYQVPPLDFVSENVVPRQILDRRAVTYNLAPQVLVPTDQLLAHGEALRQSTQQGTMTPPPTGPPPATDPFLPTNPGAPTFPTTVPSQSGARVLPPSGLPVAP